MEPQGESKRDAKLELLSSELTAGLSNEDLKPAPRRMTFAAVRALVEDAASSNSLNDEVAANALLTTRVLRLDWQGFCTCDGLDAFTECRELYLQYNRLTAVPPLEFHTRLEFLALGSNEIAAVEGLKHLSKLLYLDLSHNLIEDFDTDELPASLLWLDLRGNPCCDLTDYRDLLVELVPSLTSLDGIPVDGQMDGHAVPNGLRLGGTGDTVDVVSSDANHELVVASSTELVKAHKRMSRSAVMRVRQEYRTRRDELICRSHQRAEELRDAQTPRPIVGNDCTREAHTPSLREEKND